MRNAKRFLPLFIFIILPVLLASGCKSTQAYYRGYLSQNASNLTLVDNSSQQGNWKTFDMQLNYTAEKGNASLDIRGTGQFGLYYQLNSARIANLDLYLFFINDRTQVLETVRLFSAINISPEDQIHFAKHLQVPAGAAAISFGYYGQSRSDGGNDGEHGGGGGGTEWFAKLPKKPD